jgi:large subunit ribosomal protein L3
MFGIIGKKVGMTQIFTPDGTRHSVTVVEAGPCVVTQKKTVETDGYNALQLGFDSKKVQWKSKAQAKSGEKMKGTRKFNSVTKPMEGHFRKAGKGAFKYVREFRLKDVAEFELGQEIKAGDFDRGDVIDVIGTSKGKGFQGVVKRYGFKGGRMTHGSRFHRAPGSIGACADPARVFKNTRLPGQTGNHRVTVRNLYILSVDADNNLLYIRGAIPGAPNSLVFINKNQKLSKN